MLMLELYKHANILIVTASKTVVGHINEILQKEGLSPCTCVHEISQAKRILIDSDVDLVMIDIPLAKEDGIQFAIDLARNKCFDYSIILITKAKQSDQNFYQTERMGIVTFKRPIDPHLLVQTIHLLLSFRVKIKKLESKADKLQQRLEDDRLVSRAKILLVEHLKMSEQDAHHYIEKMAMDRCVKKINIANDIIRMYDKK